MKQISRITIIACPQATQGAGLSFPSPQPRLSSVSFAYSVFLRGFTGFPRIIIPTLRESLTQITGLRIVILSFILSIFSIQAVAAPVNLTVSQDGKGNFKTIQDAINSLPDSAAENRIIYIKNGTYNEKIFITKHHISLIGESRDKTILTYDIARDAWRCDHPDDWGVATLNLSGSDIELRNLTIINGYGYHNKENKIIDCKADSTGKKTITPRGHQMALRSFATTRLSVINCNLKSFSGDTVSPWNTADGMFYFKDCYMEGGVDFYCPRGWAYAENCTFFVNHSDAAIWHDGSGGKDQKTVLKNCKFDGYEGFKLGRYHKDAAFYLINCTFSKNMADKPIYRVPTSNVIQWGERIYYFNCHRTGGDYAWFATNSVLAGNTPLNTEIITASLVFGNRWNPVAAKDADSKGTNVGVPPAGTQPIPKQNNGIGSDTIRATPRIAPTTDLQSENMLLYQRSVGGWPKAVNEVKVDYTKTLTTAEKLQTLADSNRIDATIDNNATTKEIQHLVKAYKLTNNRAYLNAAERGIRYLLKAQYANGGWPQYYPDKSGYRHQITFNDDAMVRVLNLMQDIVEGKNNFGEVDSSLKTGAAAAVQKGIDCILKAQVKVAGKLTAWCAQYDKKTLQPDKARAFELISLSGSESVGITRFLMRQKAISPEVKSAITAAITWLESAKITGYNFVAVPDATQPKGIDHKLVPDPNSTIWARFYEIGTNKPFFSGRDSQKKYDVSQIESERRNGYAWYGTWPQKLIEVEYPEWKKR